MVDQEGPSQAEIHAAAETGKAARSVRTPIGGGGKQGTPKKVDADYRTASMIYVHVSTEDLAGLAYSSGIGSIMFTGTIYAAKEAYSSQVPFAVGALVFFAAGTLASYGYFLGLFRRIRKRSDLSAWGFFGE
jgi:hypothetical protein